MAVHIVYRSYGGENAKDRPSFYSKTLALASCIRAAQAAGVEIVFLNDGPIPEPRLSMMRAAGTVAGASRSLGMRSSYRGALQRAVGSSWPDTDVVWFSEDDYLYTEDAFQRLSGFERAHQETTYFALFGFSGTPENVEAGIAEHDLIEGWDPITVPHDGMRWTQVDSTASTFGARLGALRKDLGVFEFCMVPHKHMLRDHDTCMVLQGYPPHRTSVLLRDLVGLAPGGPKQRLRAMALAPFLLATNVRAHRLPRNRRVLLAADPNLAAHLEVKLIPGGRDWPAEAQQVQEWLDRRGDARGRLSDAAGRDTP